MQQSINTLRHVRAKNIRSDVFMYLYKTMVRPLYMNSNAAWANVTKIDLNKKQKE